MNARVGLFVVCRMGSSRLPGKVLELVGSKPLLRFVFDRCEALSERARLVVATSDLPQDDPVADYAASQGWAVFRGHHEDVAGRLLDCAKHHDVDCFFRVNGDSPFVDPQLLLRGLTTWTHDTALVTNLQPRRFPYGVALELLSTAALRRAHPQMDAYEREHVTAHFYRRPEDYHVRRLTQPRDDSALRLTIDTAEDLERFRQTVRRVGPEAWGTRSLASLLGRD